MKNSISISSRAYPVIFLSIALAAFLLFLFPAHASGSGMCTIYMSGGGAAAFGDLTQWYAEEFHDACTLRSFDNAYSLLGVPPNFGYVYAPGGFSREPLVPSMTLTIPDLDSDTVHSYRIVLGNSSYASLYGAEMNAVGGMFAVSPSDRPLALTPAQRPIVSEELLRPTLAQGGESGELDPQVAGAATLEMQSLALVSFPYMMARPDLPMSWGEFFTGIATAGINPLLLALIALLVVAGILEHRRALARARA